MPKLFRIECILLALLFSMNCIASDRESTACANGVVSNIPECGGDFVFDGLDSKMPLDSSFRIALSLDHDSAGRIAVPKSVEELYESMYRAVPNWFLIALMHSQGDDECLVTIDHVSYSMAVVDWLWRAWRQQILSSQLLKELSPDGKEADEQIKSTILDGFCQFVRYKIDRKGDQKGQSH